MKKNLANLIKVKTIATFVVLAVFAVLALNGSDIPDFVQAIITTVIVFYFGTQAKKE